MNCQQVAEILFDYVAQELTEEQCRYLETHINGCASCMAFLQSYRLTIAYSRQLRCQPVPPTLIERLRTVLVQARAT